MHTCGSVLTAPLEVPADPLATKAAGEYSVQKPIARIR